MAAPDPGGLRGTHDSPVSSAPLHLAFVGYLGHQGSEYLEATKMLVGVKVVGLVDHGKVEATGHEDAAPVFDDLEAMLRGAHPDVAVVTVPHDVHLPVIQRLVEAGVHVVIEKPLVPDSMSTRRLYELSHRSGVSIVTMTQRPLRPEFRYFRSCIERIGDPYWVEWVYNMAFPSPTAGWRSHRAQAGGGVLLDMGYHAIDVLLDAFGPATVQSATKRYRYDATKREDLEDLISASLDFQAGAIGCHLFMARHTQLKRETIEVHGTQGVVTLDVRESTVTVFSEKGEEVDFFRGPRGGTDAPAVVLSHFLELAGNRSKALAHLLHHIAAVRVCEKVYSQAKASSLGPSPQEADIHD